jgi:hypothetical protein
MNKSLNNCINKSNLSSRPAIKIVNFTSATTVASKFTQTLISK